MPGPCRVYHWWRTRRRVCYRTPSRDQAASCRLVRVRRGASRCLRATSITALVGQGDAARVGLGPDEPGARAACQEHQALAVEPQHLEDVAATAAATKTWPQNGRGQGRLHQRGQAIEALPHVGGRRRARRACPRQVRSCEATKGTQHATHGRLVDDAAHAHAGRADIDLDDAARTRGAPQFALLLSPSALQRHRQQDRLRVRGGDAATMDAPLRR